MDAKTKKLASQYLAVLLIAGGVTVEESERVVYLCSSSLHDLSRLTLPELKELSDWLIDIGKLEKEDGKLIVPGADEDILRKLLANPKYAGVPNCVARALPAMGTRKKTSTEAYDSSALDFLHRDIRNAVFAGDAKLLESSLRNFMDYVPEQYEDAKEFSFILDHWDLKEIAQLPESVRMTCFWQILPVAMRRLMDLRGLFNALDISNMSFSQRTVFSYMDVLMLKGEWEEVLRLLKKCSSHCAKSLRQGWMNVILGNDTKGSGHYIDALYEARQIETSQDYYFKTIGGIFFILSLLRKGTPTMNGMARANAASGAKNHVFAAAYSYLHAVAQYRVTGDFPLSGQLPPLPDIDQEPLECFFCILSIFWINGALTDGEKAKLEILRGKAKSGGYAWLEREIAELLNRLKNPNRYSIRKMHEDPVAEVPFILDCIPRQNAWSEKLSRISSYVGNLPARRGGRLAWLVTPGENDMMFTVKPLEQYLGKNGTWSKGRKFTAYRNQDYMTVASRSYNGDVQMTSQDKYACTILRKMQEAIANGEELDERDAWGNVFQGLARHPAVFMDSADMKQVFCENAMPYLYIASKQEFLEYRLHPVPVMDERTILRLERGNVISIYQFNDELMELRNLLGNGYQLPVDASENAGIQKQLAERYPILSEVALEYSGMMAEDANSVPMVRLQPMSNGGIQMEIFVKPFALHHGLFLPGEGPLEMIAHGENYRRRFARRFADEISAAESIVEACPALRRAEQDEEHPWVWKLSEKYDCYELTLQLREVQRMCTIQWPENKKLVCHRTVGLGSLSLHTQNYQNWFSLEGTVEIGENTNVELADFVKIFRESNGKFVELGDGQVVALSDGFRKHLEDLNRVAEIRDNTLVVQQGLAPVLQAILQGVDNVTFHEQFKEELEKIDQAMKLEPELPSGLKVTLRPYQEDGFKWLCRLDALGAGACLADDMGLGKTVQAITFFRKIAAEGPILVVAPTSVCANWQSEIKKFAPSLKVLMFGTGDREESLRQAVADTVVIVSYGLLQSEIKGFEKVYWRAAVLDEAQAIKNFHAKRSQAALHINANFKLVTTGTPVENNLGELWSIFSFINPGLLGRRDVFQQKFAQPVERENDSDALQRLNSIIHPFLLRRHKDQVLSDLPPKTEIKISVEMSPKEKEFYNNLRLEILRELEGHDETEAQMRIRVLAGIMKLRLAVCWPGLLPGGADVPGAKMEAFLELLKEAISNGHRVLVFSQFVKYLSIVRDALADNGIKYQYLDGSMTQKERAAAVKEFQEGDSPVFLISLRAGGLGLNLTKADYVIHLDSWWNPAIESQASDRAYRLGQKKPVTIYSLCVKDSIEEKILALHHWKKGLADQLLAGNDKLENISVQDLLKVLRSV